jgi:GWxTD domain-containing protein
MADMKQSIKLVFMIVIFIFTVFCSNYRKLEKLLPPEDQEFLSTVRYIISSKEKKDYLNTPAEQREKFKQEFWQRRDPTPFNEENEYKDLYFERIEKANELFADEGREGWLTDRGYVYIILGPPAKIIEYPYSVSNFYGPDMYIWYYSNYPVYFRRRGHVKATYYLSADSYSFVQKYKENSKLNFTPLEDKQKLSFKINLKKVNNQSIVEGLVPYKYINFENKNNKYEAKLKATYFITDLTGKEIKKKSREYTLLLTKDDLDNLEEEYLIKEVFDIPRGKYGLKVVIEDVITKESSQRTKKIEIK